MGVDPISLDTTTIGITDTLPEYHAGDNGLRERNLYSSDTKNERISISSSISLSQDSLSNSLPWNKVPNINYEVATEFAERLLWATFC